MPCCWQESDLLSDHERNQQIGNQMNSNIRIFIIHFCLSIFFCGSLVGQYQKDERQLNKAEKDRLIELAADLFIQWPDIAFTISTSDITPDFESIPNPIEYDQAYLDSLLGVHKEDESNSLITLKIAGYYAEKEQSRLAQSYYEKAFENLHVDSFKDSAAYFSNRAVLKNRLGKEDALEDLKKSLAINPNDSLAIQIYPMLLMQDDQYKKAREVLWYALENGYGSKRVAYMKLIGIEATEAGKRISTMESQGVNVKKKSNKKNYDEIMDFSLIEKYANMHPNKLEITWMRRIADIVGLFSKMTFLAEIENDSLRFPFTDYDRQKIESLIREFSEASEPEAINTSLSI
jgi:tetratricopeptide (TPR) repeat protein